MSAKTAGRKKGLNTTPNSVTWNATHVKLYHRVTWFSAEALVFLEKEAPQVKSYKVCNVPAFVCL